MTIRSGALAALIVRWSWWALLGVLTATTGAETAPLDLSKAYRQRRALVIGINTYTRWERLTSARGDAEAVGEKLEALGFTVEYLLAQLPRYRDRSTDISIGCTACE